MTLEELNAAIERDVQLHESFELFYCVDGWAVSYSPDDGKTQLRFFGKTPLEAMILCFNWPRNQRRRK